MREAYLKINDAKNIVNKKICDLPNVFYSGIDGFIFPINIDDTDEKNNVVCNVKLSTHKRPTKGTH